MNDPHGLGRTLSLVLAGMLLGAIMLAPATASNKAPHTKKQLKGIKHRVVALEASHACPTGTTAFAGGCIETAARGAAGWFDAAKACTAAAGRLPSADELFAYGELLGVELQGDEHTGDLAGDGTVHATIDDGGVILATGNFEPRQFRCVLPLPRPA